MNADQFNVRLKELARITGLEQYVDAWPHDYAELLDQVKADKDKARRFGHANRMRWLLMHQVQYLINSWLRMDRETAIVPTHPTTGTIQ